MWGGDGDQKMAQSILLQERLSEECGVNDFLRRGGERLKRVYSCTR